MKTFQNRKWDTDPTLIYKGGCPSVPTADVPTPQAKREPFRILLSERTSQALADAGESYWQIVAKGTHPDLPGRWVIGLRPITTEMAVEIEGILRGTHHTVKNRPAKAAQPTAACDPSPAMPDAPQAILVPSSTGTATGTDCHKPTRQPAS